MIFVTGATLAAFFIYHRRRRAKQEVDWALHLEGLTSEEVETLFERAVSYVSSRWHLSTRTKLDLYGCYKHVKAGDCPQLEPPAGIEASMKWEAWTKHVGKTKVAAMQDYVKTLGDAVPHWCDPVSPTANETDSDDIWDDDGDDPQEKSTGFGNFVSTLNSVDGDDEDTADVDDSPVGLLNRLIEVGNHSEANNVLRSNGHLAFMPDKDGMTPLHWAADRGRIAVVKLLIEMAGVGPDAVSRLSMPDDSGDTPLHYAITTEQLEVAQALAHAGADLKVPNGDHETPLALAADLGWDEVLLMGGPCAA